MRTLPVISYDRRVTPLHQAWGRGRGMRGILGRGRGMRAVWRGNDTARRFLHLCTFASWRPCVLIQPPANKFEATKNTKSTSVDSPIPGIPGIPGIPDSKTGCNHTYICKTNRIGSDFLPRRGNYFYLRRILGFVW